MRTLLYENVIGPFSNTAFILFRYTPNPDEMESGFLQWVLLHGPHFSGEEEDLITGPDLDAVKILPGRLIEVQVYEVKRLSTKGIEVQSRSLLPMVISTGDDEMETEETVTALLGRVTSERAEDSFSFGCSTVDCGDFMPCPFDKPALRCSGGTKECYMPEPPGGGGAKAEGDCGC